jgi:hypothetical protein
MLPSLAPWILVNSPFTVADKVMVVTHGKDAADQHGSSPLCGWPGRSRPAAARLTHQYPRGQGPDYPFPAPATAGAQIPTPAGRRRLGSAMLWRGGSTWLDQPCPQGHAGEVGAAAAAGLVPDPVQVGADSADADEQSFGDLGVGDALGDQLFLPGAEPPGSGRPARGAGVVISSTYSAAAAVLIAALRSAAARGRSGPSTCWAWRWASRRRAIHGAVSMFPPICKERSSASVAASSVTASA